MPRWIVIHSRVDPLPLDGSAEAHVFGPFDSWEEADADHHAHPDDCFTSALVVVGPDPRDVRASADIPPGAPGRTARPRLVD